MIPGGVTPRIYASQNDHGLRVFVFNLVDENGGYAIPSGTTALLNVLKPDRTVVSETCTWSGSTVTADCTEQMTAVAGNVHCEVRLVAANGDAVGSANFILGVESNPLASGVVSESDFDSISDMVDRAVAAASIPPTYVTDWLDENITQETGYVIDKSLTIENAAADAKAAGDLIRASFVVGEASGSIASFADGADGVPLKDLVVNISPVQSGTGDPSPSNVRAISGWTAANIARTGKNFLDNTKTTTTVNGVTFTVNEDKSVTANGTATANAQLTLTLQSYIFGDVKFYGCSGGSPSTYNVYMWDSTVGARPKKWNGVDASGNAEGVFSEAKLIPGHINQLSLRVNVGATVNNVVLYPMICAPTETNIEYEPYNGNAYNISFGDAGTVYGGTLDVTSGMLTVEYGLFTFTNQTWTMVNSTTYRYYNANFAEGRFNNDANVISNWLPNAVGGSAPQFLQSGDVNNHNIYIYHADAIDASITDAASLKAYITSNPLQVVYKLQNPISIQLDPVSVASLLGNNNIWSDTGSVASCEYRADTKLYLEKLTNPDDDMVANANITSGSYFMVGNSLYLATANIANGGAITPGTNCTATNLAAALNAINS